MKISVDTTRDQPRLIRAAVAMILAALDDGAALPLNTPAALVPTEGERLAAETRADQIPPLAPLPEDTTAAQRAFDPNYATFAGGRVETAPLAQPAAPAPSTAVVAPLPPAPVAPLATLPPPPAPPAPVPLPVPAAPAPSAPAAPSNPAPAGVDIDRDGLPWDARIHAATKTKTADGRWKLKKGMGSMEVYVKGIETELRATMAIPGPLATPAPYVAPPPPPVAVIPPPAPLPPQVSGVSMSPPGTMPAAPAVVASPTDFGGFMSWLAHLIAAGRWTHAQTPAALQTMGIPNAVALSARPDLIPQAVQAITALLPA